ncbi:MAG: hypothetical protein OJF52_000052 [Nitrospira sp.]|jgi:hypothetical protein|nr:MAG: hypothetical protein OJF52_000052 [Nitrospira sp.]
MNHGALITFVLMSLVAGPAVAQGQSLGSERTRPAGPSASSDMTRTPGSSWEGWLNHGERDGTPKSYIPPRSPDLGTPTAPLSPSIGPGSGLLGPEAGRSPSRLRSNGGTDLGETGIGNGRR